MRIPILWRTLLQGYMRIFLLSVSTFLAVLLVSRFKEIARFTALSGHLGKTLFFTAYQFPLILPIAFPISALIAATLLFQRLSRSHELIAYQAAGISLRSIVAPLLFASFLLSIANFSLCAEIAPFCRRASKSLLYRETSINPLLLLQRQQLIKVKRAYFHMDIEEEGKQARNALFIAHNDAYPRLGLFQALELSLDQDNLLGRQVTIISPLDSGEGFDSLLVENQTSMSTAASILSQFLKKNRPRLDTTALPLRMLELRARLASKKLSSAALIEILRRCSLSLAVLSFTLLGCAFGLERGRSSRSQLLTATLLTLTVLVAYLMGKEFKSHPHLATLIFLLPHLLIWIASCIRLSRTSRGFV